MSLEITTMLVLSTAHLTEFTCNTVLPSWDGPAWQKSEYGWFVYIPDDIDAQDMPEDLKACLEYAHREGCGWVMFDCDGDTIDGLETFDW